MDEDQGTGNVRLERGETSMRTQQRATAATTSSVDRATRSIMQCAADLKRAFQAARM